jgi:hypothetical protein
VAKLHVLRVFIGENGTNAVLLATRLRQKTTMRQGRESLILAEPRPDGTVEIGGRTELVEVREYEGGSL